MFCISYLKLSLCLSSVNIDLKVLLYLIVVCLFVPYSMTHNEMYNFKKVKVILGVCIVVTYDQKNMLRAIGTQTTRLT